MTNDTQNVTTENAVVAAAAQPPQPQGEPVNYTKELTAYFTTTYGIPQNMVLDTIKATCFTGKAAERATAAQLMMFLSVAKQYNLNPFVKEIFAFPNDTGGVTPIVGVDGFLSIALKDPNYLGHDYVYATNEVKVEDVPNKKVPEWIECVVRVKGAGGERTVRVREYFDECYRKPFKNHTTGRVSTGPWQSHPRRMLRHKATIQALRLAVGLHGIYDEDEASRMGEQTTLTSTAYANDLSSRIGDGLTDAGIVPVDVVQDTEAQSDDAPAEAAEDATNEDDMVADPETGEEMERWKIEALQQERAEALAEGGGE